MCSVKGITKCMMAFGLLLCLTSFQHIPHSKERNTFTIHFKHVVGQRPLWLDSATYTNALGQPFTVSAFKYYVSHVHLIKSDGSIQSNDGYYLIDEETEASKSISLKVREADYSAIEFIIGVDSAHNCSGLQTGALDPVNGMFWAWNTGYIFFKLDGTSPSSTQPKHLIEYHIGGFKEPNNAIRKVHLDIPSTGKSRNELTLKADILKSLKGAVVVDFSKLPSVTDIHYSTDIANNYMYMFSLEE